MHIGSSILSFLLNQLLSHLCSPYFRLEFYDFLSTLKLIFSVPAPRKLQNPKTAIDHRSLQCSRMCKWLCLCVIHVHFAHVDLSSMYHVHLQTLFCYWLCNMYGPLHLNTSRFIKASCSLKKTLKKLKKQPPKFVHAIVEYNLTFFTMANIKT